MNDSTLKAILEACNRTFFEFAAKVYELTDYAGNPKTYKEDHEGLFKQIRKTSLTELSLTREDFGKVIGIQGRTAGGVGGILEAASGRLKKHSTLEIIE